MKKTIYLIFLISLSFIILQNVFGQAYYKRDLSKIQYGMSMDEVRSILGRPHEINIYAGKSGETQQWIYREGRGKWLYLYFDDGEYTYYQRFGYK